MVKNKEIVELEVEGMDCNNCAMSISRFLERKGLEDVFVNFQTKEVRFRRNDDQLTVEQVKNGIQKLGYKIVEASSPQDWWTLERKLWISAAFTLPLLLHHLLMMAGSGLPFLHSNWVQFALCLPPFVIGFLHFGRSALSSIRGGVPNMDVLIFIGSTAAFAYSVIGTLMHRHEYIFYETSATIITLVLVGNWLEKRAVEQTTTAIGELSKLQVEKAKRVMPSGTIVSVSREDLQLGNILQINEGDRIPIDGKILEGEAEVDESMLTGESEPVFKQAGDEVIGSSLLLSGNLRIEVSAIGKDTVLSQMIELVKTAQQDKPALQRLADQISAIFVPVVLVIALLTFSVGHWIFDLSAQQAMMNAIAVLVISCPCAMGLATPTAVMVGVGRLARNGILVKGGQTVETFANIKTFVFDKTGTLTTGRFRIKNIDYKIEDQKKVNALIYGIERHSSHPIAQSLVREMESRINGLDLGTLEVEEIKGGGLRAKTSDGRQYRIGSERLVGLESPDHTDVKSVFLTENDQLIATIEIEDELKPEAAELIRYLQSEQLHPVILSGDKEGKTAAIAGQLGIDEYYAEQQPQEKLQKIEALSQQAPTAMIGDGINDAPALARATIGVSLSNASQVAIQSAQIILLKGQLDHLPKAIKITRATVKTIKQSLFWAFAYNIVAIPIAAMGLLNPRWGALFMAFSDVVVIGNAVRLRNRKL
jgi:Cu+-exporting ATPase